MTNYLLSRRTPVYDHAGELLYHATAERAQALLERHDVQAGISGRRVRSFSLCGPDPAHLSMSGSKHRRGIGDPYRHENYWNPPRCWAHNRIPPSFAEYFTTSVTERMAAWAPNKLIGQT